MERCSSLASREMQVKISGRSPRTCQNGKVGNVKSPSDGRTGRDGVTEARLRGHELTSALGSVWQLLKEANQWFSCGPAIAVHGIYFRQLQIDVHTETTHTCVFLGRWCPVSQGENLPGVSAQVGGCTEWDPPRPRNSAQQGKGTNSICSKVEESRGVMKSKFCQSQNANYYEI